MAEHVSILPPGSAGPEKWDANFRGRVEERRTALREELAALPWPGRPAVLEIGCGHGHFLTAFAAAFPQRFCLGLDLQRGRLEKARRKAGAAGLVNARFVLAEAAECLDGLPESALFDQVFVLFPDPWPKRRHHKNRVLQPAFLSAMARRTTASAELFFRTDHRPYFEQVAADLERHPDWEQAAELSWPLETKTVFQEKADRHDSLRAVRRDPSTT